MSKTREINIKPSCMSEIYGFPSGQVAQLWEKINYLVDNPFPDGKLKKKLKQKQDLYRLRVGNFRIFYTFGDTWVRLLGIRRRNERRLLYVGMSRAMRGLMVIRNAACSHEALHDLVTDHWHVEEV